MMVIYTKCVMSQGFNYIYDLIFIVFGIYFLLYCGFFFLKSKQAFESVKKFAYSKLNVATESTETTIKEIPMKIGLNFTALNKIISSDQESIIQDVEENHFPTFLHELAYHFQMKNYKEINSFDPRKYCPTTLTQRQNRAKYCKEAKRMIDHFYHYSHVLKMPINKNNHIYYFLLLLQQFAMFSLFFVALFAMYYPQTNNWKIFVIEIGYLLGVKHGLYAAFFYLVFIILSCYNFFYFGIEVYGITNNLTWNEIFNRNKYNYLFKIKKDPRGQFVKYFYNPYDKGLLKNVKEYVMRAF
mmetsp:Transcript_36406/g.32679  ORF Transcript_36406/g.32679 Transcript_36406/m.32679 type:complete len:298 (+) Transcript_36406:1039-1932(+)